MTNIYTKITNNSWSQMPSDKASEYLDYYPKDTKEFIFDFLKRKISEDSNPKVIDVCSGNGINYSILKKKFKNYNYNGIDCSANLVAEAKKRSHGDNMATFTVSDCYEYLDNHKQFYDLSILFHILECSESPDFLIGKCLYVSKYVAIGWFDPPADRWDVCQIMPSTFPDFVENAPYIRRRISNEYYDSILKKHNAKIIETYGSGSNVVHIITKI